MLQNKPHQPLIQMESSLIIKFYNLTVYNMNINIKLSLSEYIRLFLFKEE